MDVIVFGMENCPGCVTVKSVLKQKGVEFIERDVMNIDHMEEAQKHGVRGVPTVIVVKSDAVHVFTGSAKPVINSLLLQLGV